MMSNLLESGPLGWWFTLLLIYGIYVLVSTRDPFGNGNDPDFRVKWIMMYLFLILPLAFGVGAVVIGVFERFF